MTGSYRIELNDIPQKQYGRSGHVEGIELPNIIWGIYATMHRGDKISIICELEG
jgi:hypothetical protein